jgi:hypothetical protein
LDTEELCLHLSQLSLLLSYDLAKRTIRLHDVIRAYLQKARQAQVVATHNALLNACALATWAELPAQEPYLWRQLAYHLDAAQRTADLRQLVFDFGWVQAKLAATDINALLSDFDYTSRGCELRFCKQLKAQGQQGSQRAAMGGLRLG